MDQDNDKLLDDLGRRMRAWEDEDDQRFDERWRRLTADTLSESDDEALRALANESEDARQDYEALSTLGPEFHDRIAREWQAAALSNVSYGPWSTSLYSGLVAAATLAITVVGWQYWPKTEEAKPLPALPGYTMALSGASSEVRSQTASAEVPIFDQGNRLRLWLRPNESLSDDLATGELSLERRLFLEASDRTLEPWLADSTTSRDGSVKIEGVVGQDLGVGPDDRAIIFLYGHSGHLPESETLASIDLLEAAAMENTAWHFIREPFQVKTALPGPTLRVELAGCKAFTVAGGCVATDPLTVWVGAPRPTRIKLRIGEKALQDLGTAVDGGRRFTFEVSPEDREVEILATLGGVTTERIQLNRRQPAPQWLETSNQLIADGELEAARQELERHIDGASPRSEALALGRLARVLWRQDTPRAAILNPLERAIDLHEQSGDLLNLVRDLGMAIHIDIAHRDLSLALDRLERMGSALPQGAPAEAKLYLLDSSVLLERRLGFLRQALELAQSKVHLAHRLGLDRKRAQATEMMALVLQDLGHFAAADELLSEVELSYPEQECELMRVFNNRAWGLIRAADSELGDPSALHARAQEIAERGSCSTASQLDVLLDQAWVLIRKHDELSRQQELEQGEQTSAEISRMLERVDALKSRATPHQLLWREYILGLWHLQSSRPVQALQRFGNLETQSLARAFPEGQWLAQLGRAKAYRALGQLPDALAELEATEALLDSHTLMVPLHTNRGRFLNQREESAQLLIETLLDTGRIKDAFDAARRSRSRLLRGVHLSHRLENLSPDQRQSWQAAITEYLRVRGEVEDAAEAIQGQDTASLQQALEHQSRLLNTQLDRAFQVVDQGMEASILPPLGDDIYLVYHPLSEGWVGFGALEERLLHYRFNLPETSLERSEGLAQKLLEPFRELLGEGRQLRILAFGRLNGLDFHALPWDGGVLLEAHAVVYDLDLPEPTQDRPIGRALIVSDPLRDLAAALQEGDAVASALRSSADWEVLRLTQDEATRTRLLDLLGSRLDLLHYAGHGAFDTKVGWESSLLLARDSRLTQGDVLALGDRVPREVVLSSCESASTENQGIANLGLAQAFLAAGAERVIAATRPVGDDATDRLFRDLYEAREPLDLGAALRRAQLAQREAEPDSDWASFRLIEP